MKAVILFSHGSTLCGAGENLKQLSRTLEAGGLAPIVETGFLNFSAPSFEDAFERCVLRGATEITIAPYFLVAGYFVKVSLPPKIEDMSQRHPQVRVQIAEALKRHDFLATALLGCAQRAQGVQHWRDALANAPAWCQDSPQCPLHATSQCPHQRVGEEVSPALALPPVAWDQVPAAGVAPQPDTALLVMVHGSPRPESNLDMYAVVDRARRLSAYATVEVGFMECNEPDIPAAVQTCVETGAKKVVAVPYFLHTGTHVANDLPELMEEAVARYPEVEFAMGDYIGHHPLLGQVLSDRVRECWQENQVAAA